MKKTLVLLFALLLALFAFGCKKAQGNETAITNPAVDVASFSDFAPLELYIDAPEGAKNVRYRIIADEIAEVLFALNGQNYCLRAARLDADISGVYKSFDAEETLVRVGEEGDAAVLLRIRTIACGAEGALADWRCGNAAFTLYTGDAVECQSFFDLAIAAAERVLPYHGAN